MRPSTNGSTDWTSKICRIGATAAIVADISLEQWVRLGVAGAFDNIQVRRLTLRVNGDVPFRQVTRQMLDEAKRVLEERVDFLGVTERYEESIRLFAKQLDWRELVTVEHLNVSTNRQAAADLPPSSRAAILDDNSFDLELYAFAVQLFERRLSIGATRRTADR